MSELEDGSRAGDGESDSGDYGSGDGGEPSGGDYGGGGGEPGGGDYGGGGGDSGDSGGESPTAGGQTWSANCETGHFFWSGPARSSYDAAKADATAHDNAVHGGTETAVVL